MKRDWQGICSCWMGMLLLPGIALGQTAGSLSAWQALIAQTPTLVDDTGVSWTDRLALDVLTPEQGVAYRAGKSAADLQLADGRRLAEYLQERASTPASTYVGLSGKCALFAEPWPTETIHELAVREPCGLAEDAVAVVLELRAQSAAGVPLRVKVWGGDLPEPATTVLETEGTVVPARYQATTIVNLCANAGCAGGDLRLRSTAATLLGGDVIGYFRPLATDTERNAAAGKNTGGTSIIQRQSTESSDNNFFGTNAGASITSGASNAFFGGNAGFSNTSGSSNSFFGSHAGANNTSGTNNTFVGDQAGTNNTSGTNNTFIGDEAGITNTTGSYNASLGFDAGYSNTSGGSNAFFGYAAGSTNTTGNNNTFVGKTTGQSNTVENNNSFIGAGANGAAGITNATAIGALTQVSQSNSLVLGSIAGVNSAAASVNVGIGTSTPSARLHVRDTLDANTFITVENAGTGLSSAGVLRAQSNAATVNFQAHGSNRTLARFGQTLGGWAEFLQVTGNGLLIGTLSANPLILGTAAANRLTIASNGNIGLGGVVSPTQPLQHATGAYLSAGGVWTNASSRALKDDIRALTAAEAGETLAALAPVHFRYKADPEGEHYLGFIAEDVPAAVARADRKSLNPMDFVAVLAKVAQDQQVEISALKAEVAKQQARIAEEQAEISALKGEVAGLRSVQARLAEIEARLAGSRLAVVLPQP